MKERGITEDDIRHALQNHHTSYATSRQNSVVYIGPGLSGEDLEVYTLPPG
jgi:hypothetical protein